MASFANVVERVGEGAKVGDNEFSNVLLMLATMDLHEHETNEVQPVKESMKWKTMALKGKGDAVTNDSGAGDGGARSAPTELKKDTNKTVAACPKTEDDADKALMKKVLSMRKRV